MSAKYFKSELANGYNKSLSYRKNNKRTQPVVDQIRNIG